MIAKLIDQIDQMCHKSLTSCLPIGRQLALRDKITTHMYFYKVADSVFGRIC